MSSWQPTSSSTPTAGAPVSLPQPPLVGESRAAWLKHYAALHGCDLRQSFAYADSHSDLPMLQTVGNPVAVSPDIPLMRAAQRNSWSVVPWRGERVPPRR